MWTVGVCLYCVSTRVLYEFTGVYRLIDRVREWWRLSLADGHSFAGRMLRGFHSTIPYPPNRKRANEGNRKVAVLSGRTSQYCREYDPDKQSPIWTRHNHLDRVHCGASGGGVSCPLI